MKMTNLLFALMLSIAASISWATEQSDDRSVYKIPKDVIDETFNFHHKSVKVLGSNISYLDEGKGRAVIFVHGNPTSSYLWRNVLPFVAEGNRVVALDLIGMGQSDKPNIDYTFADHYRYFSAFIDTLGLQTVSLVGHDWGAALVWEYARKNPHMVKRLAFMEGVLPPAFPVASYESMGPKMGDLFKKMQDPVMGKKMIIDDNMFVEQILPGFVSRPLGALAMKKYRAPFLSLSSRKPVLVWPVQVPIAGQPKQTVRTLENIRKFMGKTDMPVLLLYASPGVLVPPAAVPWYVERISKLETSFVGAGLHFIQEDQPQAIGRALADWLRRN